MAASDTWTALADFATNEVVTATKLNQQLRDNLNVLQLGLNGDGSTQSQGVHAHKTGTLANRPAAGKAGRLYYTTDLGVTFLDDGTTWIYFSHNERVCEYYRNDFVAPGGNNLSASGWLFGWHVDLFGGGAKSAQPSAGASTTSIKLITGASSASGARLSPYDNSLGIFATGAFTWTPLIWECQLRLVSELAIDVHWGIVDQLSTARPPIPNSSIMFRRQDDGNIFAVSRDNGGTEQTTDTGISPSTDDMKHYLIEVNAAESSITFYIDGLLKASHTTSPTVEVIHPGFGIRSGESILKEMWIDTVSWMHTRDV